MRYTYNFNGLMISNSRAFEDLSTLASFIFANDIAAVLDGTGQILEGTLLPAFLDGSLDVPPTIGIPEVFAS